MTKETLHYAFDENTGTTAQDTSENTYNGTLSTSGLWSSSGLNGSCIKVVVNTDVDLPNDVGYTTEVSVFSWWKYVGTAGGTSGGYHIICGGQNLEISIPQASGALRAGVTTSVTRYVDEFGSGLNDGNWHSVGLSFNESTGVKSSYIDGELVGVKTGITGTLIYNFANRTIGSYGGIANYYANGYIDGYRIFAKEISANKFKWLHNQGYGRIQNLNRKYGAEDLWYEMETSEVGSQIMDSSNKDTNGIYYSKTLKTIYTVTNNGGNSYLYEDMSSVANYTIVSGDYLEYDIYLENNAAKTAFDFTTTIGNNLRDSGSSDQNGLSAHPAADLSTYAYKKWYHRKISLSARVGTTIAYYDLACEYDATGVITANFKNMYIRGTGGVLRRTVYASGTPTFASHFSSAGSTVFTSGTAYTDRLPGYVTEDGREALSFNGISEYVDTFVRPDATTESFSICVWVKDIPSGHAYAVSQMDSVSGYSSSWIIGYDNGGVFLNSTSIGGSNIISDGDWHLIGFTWDGTTAELFIDAVSKGTATPTFFAPVGDIILMANGLGSLGTGSFCKGYVSELRMEKKVFTQKDWDLIYNDGDDNINSLADNYGCEIAKYDFDNNAEDDSRYKNTGVNTGFSYSTTHKVGTHSLSCDGSGNVNLGNPEQLQITGNQTICFWMYNNTVGTRQNPYAKAYAGEGTITLETDGDLSYYYGNLGLNGGSSGTNYQGVRTIGTPPITNGKWNWVCLVRDLTNMEISWYINNKLNTTVAAIFSEAMPGLLPAYIGYGYVSALNGLIDDFRINNFAFGENERNFVWNKGEGTSESLPLKSWFKFDETAGIILTKDGVSMEHNGINTGGDFQSPGIYFDGDTDNLKIPDFFKYDNDFSISFSHKRSSHTVSNRWRTLFCFDGGGHQHYCLYNPDNYDGEIGTYNLGQYRANFFVPDDGEYHDYVITYNDTNCLFYVDGVYRGTSAYAVDSKTDPLSVIGNYASSGANQPAGYMKDVKFYTKGLTADEIRTMRGQGRLLK